MLELKNITAGYTSNDPVIENINLIIEPEKKIGILGRNGAGKSTLALTVMGMIPFFNGKILLNGNAIHHLSTEARVKNGIGFLRQDKNVFPHLTVEENLKAASLHLKKADFVKHFMELHPFFTLFQDKSKLRQEASYLSGGERQQLALAMVMLGRPVVLVLDEPSQGLSPERTSAMYQLLESLYNKFGFSSLLIEQNRKFVIDFCDPCKKLVNKTLKDYTP